jgi:hypothetical protein
MTAVVQLVAARTKLPAVNTAEERAKYQKRMADNDALYTIHMGWVHEAEEA